MPKTKYGHRVEVDGQVVWSGDFDEATSKNFPSEWRDRPKDGDPGWSLHIDDECIGTQVSQAEETAQRGVLDGAS